MSFNLIAIAYAPAYPLAWYSPLMLDGIGADYSTLSSLLRAMARSRIAYAMRLLRS